MYLTEKSAVFEFALFKFRYLSYNGKVIKGWPCTPWDFTPVLKTVSRPSIIAFGFCRLGFASV